MKDFRGRFCSSSCSVSSSTDFAGIGSGSSLDYSAEGSRNVILPLSIYVIIRNSSRYNFLDLAVLGRLFTYVNTTGSKDYVSTYL